MVDLHLNPNMNISNNVSILSPKPSSKKQNTHQPSLYEQYLRLPELSQQWNLRDFPNWNSEPLVKPALQALEITFRLVSLILSDPRPYANTTQWIRSLSSLCSLQLEIISEMFCGSERVDNIPVQDMGSSRGVMARERSSQEVWKLDGSNETFLSCTSVASLLPRLAEWEKSSRFAQRMLLQIESSFGDYPFTLGLGEPNLSGKPYLEYDIVVKPTALHALKPNKKIKNQENEALFAIHHVLESWLCCSKELLKEISEKIIRKEWENAASDCWLLEKMWKLFTEIEDLHVMMDPDDFLRLKTELSIKSSFCFRSAALVDVTEKSKNLKHNVPDILGVEVDPNGGPRVQEAAMRLLHSSRRGEGEDRGRLHLLQALQAVEAAEKKYFFGYRQMVMAVMGSLEATGNRGLVGMESLVSADPLSQMFLEPPYFPSLDAAKTFLGEMWQHELRK